MHARNIIRDVLLILVFTVMVGCGSHTASGPRFISFGSLANIGMAIRDYANDHGTLPQKLSDLVPRYITADQIGIFYVRNEYVKNSLLPSDWAFNPNRIDEFSSYVYLGSNGVHDILAFERADLWKTNAPHSGELAALFKDFHVEDVPKEKLKEWIPAKMQE